MLIYLLATVMNSSMSKEHPTGLFTLFTLNIKLSDTCYIIMHLNKLTSAICTLRCFLVSSVYALCSVSRIIKLEDSGCTINFLGVYSTGNDTCNNNHTFNNYHEKVTYRYKILNIKYVIKLLAIKTNLIKNSTKFF